MIWMAETAQREREKGGRKMELTPSGGPRPALHAGAWTARRWFAETSSARRSCRDQIGLRWIERT